MKDYKKCKITGCPNKMYNRGYCNKHFRAGLADGSIPKVLDRKPRALCECGQLAQKGGICEDCHALEKAKPVKPVEYVESETYPSKPIEKPYSKITTYMLSPEELARYQAMPPPTKENYTFQPAWTKQQARGNDRRMRNDYK